jgi:hypothetical protein
MNGTTKSLIRLFVFTITTWFGTFGENTIAQNFIYFLNFYALVVIAGYTLVFDNLKKSLSSNDVPNKYVHFCSWIAPSCILIASGWIASGILFFITWSVASARISQFISENDKQSNDS